jgi:tetratricopeptide (TPR) repeat protein
MPIRSAFGLGVLLAVVLSAAITRAQATPSAAETEEQARAHFRLGRAHYDNGNFAQAAVEFEEAYRISQRAALLYNIYLAYRDANDTRNAAEALRKYLALEKNIENRGQLESRLAALDKSLKDNPSPPVATSASPAGPTTPAESAQPLAPAPAEADTTPAPGAAVAASEPAARPFPVLPVVLMGTGGVMAVTSIITGIMANGKSGEWADAREACEDAGDCNALSSARVQELEDIKSSGQTLAVVTDILLFGGLAVAGTGVVLFLLDQGASEKAPATTAGLACVPGACGAKLRTTF